MSQYDKSRRSFLQSLLVATPGALAKFGPLTLFLESIIVEAYGQEAVDESVNNYIGIMMTGGPPRWVFDLPLNPTTGPFDHNLMTSNMIQGGDFKYVTKQIGDYKMPIIWDKMIPTIGGSGSIKMSDMLQNMMMFRGYNLEVDGHAGNRIRHFRPSIGGNSMDGIVGSQSKRPIPSVASGASWGFTSPTGSSQVEVSLGDNNPLSTIMANFQMSGSRNPAATSSKAVEDAFDQVLKAFESRAHKDNKAIKGAHQNRLNAKTIFKRKFGDLKSYYDTRLSAYRSLEQKVFTNNSFSLGAGIQDHSYFDVQSSHGLPTNHYRINSINQRGTDLPDYGTDLRDAFSNSTTVNSMAHNLAITEFLLENNLSSAITLQFNNLRGLKIGARNNYSLTNDGHRNGVVTSLFFYSKYYQAIAAGLNEFRSFLQSKNIFDKTVVQLSGDFNRNARANGQGSDHGWHGSNTTIMSGMIKSHAISGHCRRDTGGNYKGDWGRAAPMDILDGSEMVMGNVATSMATMLECESPTGNFPSLVTKNPVTGEVTLLPGAGAKNV